MSRLCVCPKEIVTCWEQNGNITVNCTILVKIVIIVFSPTGKNNFGLIFLLADIVNIIVRGVTYHDIPVYAAIFHYSCRNSGLY